MPNSKLRSFSFLYAYENENEDVEYISEISLANYTKLRLKNPNEVIINDNEITIIFDYPLKKEIKIEFKSKNDKFQGFTRCQLINNIVETYEKMYNEITYNDDNILNNKYDIWVIR